jgi:hypothetical protein
VSAVVSIHEFELGPEVSDEAFEKLVLEEWVPAWSQVPGMGNFKLLKGNRGARDGKYTFTFEMESVERRDQLFPQPGVGSERIEQFQAAHPGLVERLESFLADNAWTDYGVFNA